jgi:hypothetical protein
MFRWFKELFITFPIFCVGDNVHHKDGQMVKIVDISKRESDNKQRYVSWRRVNLDGSFCSVERGAVTELEDPNE